MKKEILPIALLLLFVPFLINAQDGILDPSFNGNGSVITDFENRADFGEFIAIQEDGKILVAGTSKDSTGLRDFSMARYHSDGSLDDSFGSGGQVITDFDGNDDLGRSLALQKDGKILFAGSTSGSGTSNRDFAIARYDSLGHLDLSFGFGGQVITDIDGDHDIATSMALQADGKILLAGSSNSSPGNRDFSLLRYQADGSLDTSFGVDGKVITDFEKGNDLAYSAAIQADHKILLAGVSTNNLGDTEFALVRYHSDGSLDDSFGNGGKVNTIFEDGNDVVKSIAIQVDGKILAAGFMTNSDQLKNFALARYHRDGLLDSSFGSGGRVSTAISSGNDYGEAVAIQEDGKILVVGSTIADTIFNMALSRYDTTGLLDSSFGMGGIVFSKDANLGEAIAIQKDGKILVAGTSDPILNADFAVARYLSGLETGLIDFSSEKNPLLIYPNPIWEEALLKYDLSKKENITISLFDLSGKLLKNILSDEKRSAGKHQQKIYLDSSLPSGTYLLLIDNGFGQQGIKIIKQ